jgi:hypothetical protein
MVCVKHCNITKRTYKLLSVAARLFSTAQGPGGNTHPKLAKGLGLFVRTAQHKF